MNTSDDSSPGIAEEEAIEIVRSLPHGNVAAVLGSARRVGLDKLLSPRPCREQDLVMAMVVDRIISPGSKLSGSNGLQSENAQNTLADELGLGDVGSKEMAAEQGREKRDRFAFSLRRQIDRLDARHVEFCLADRDVRPDPVGLRTVSPGAWGRVFDAPGSGSP